MRYCFSWNVFQRELHEPLKANGCLCEVQIFFQSPHIWDYENRCKVNYRFSPGWYLKWMMPTDFDETHRGWRSYIGKSGPKISSQISKECLFYRGAKFGSFLPSGVGFKFQIAILKSFNWDNDETQRYFDIYALNMMWLNFLTKGQGQRLHFPFSG
jgi:hypothetical protein